MAASNQKALLDKLINTIVEQGGADLHLSEGRHPTIRVNNDLVPLSSHNVLTKEDTAAFLKLMLNEDKMKSFIERQEVDFSYATAEARFRGNGFIQQGKVGIVMRLIPNTIRTLEELNVPPIVAEFAKKEQGFFLVVGPVGQGKTTTLAALIEMINQQRAAHIITIENPIEYIYDQKQSIVDQREVSIDTESFETALVSSLRQDVDVILVGEMRNRHTMQAAITAAETGHLVFSTLHTNNASQTIDRIIDSFPGEQQDQIRLQLSGSMTGIFSQRLLPRISGGRIPAFELLINNNAVANLIREKRVHEIDTVIQTGAEHGMIDMNRSLADLIRRGEVRFEDAQRYSLNPEILEKLI